MADMSGLWRTWHRSERQLPKLNVVGSSPITRSIVSPVLVAGCDRPWQWVVAGSGTSVPLCSQSQRLGATTGSPVILLHSWELRGAVGIDLDGKLSVLGVRVSLSEAERTDPGAAPLRSPAAGPAR